MGQSTVSTWAGAVYRNEFLRAERILAKIRTRPTCPRMVADRGPGPEDNRYRDTVRAMTAVEHFGTDYRPVAPEGRTGCLCDAEPGMFAVFAFAVLALHRGWRAREPGSVCGCGEPADACPVRALAEVLLLAPAGDAP